MPIIDQVKSLTEEIEASYETRIAAVSDLAKATHQAQENFRREHEKMASGLRRSLASNRAARTSHVQKMRAENAKALEDTASELKEMAEKVAEFRAASEKERRQEFATVIREIKGVVAAIEKDTAKTLADFRSDHKEMAKALKTSLSSETKERTETIHNLLARFTKEHEEMAGSLRSELSSFQRSLSKAVDDMLAGFSADHQQSLTHWENLTKVMAAKRADKPVPSAKAEAGAPTSLKARTEKKSVSKKNGYKHK